MIIIFYSMREETHSINKSSLSIVMVGIWVIDELLPWISFVHYILGAQWIIEGTFFI
jgi:hypothetical protein